MRRFRESGRSVLLGTASFWEGVDVPGPSLSLVVIDRIPFPRPDDPLAGQPVHRLDAVARLKEKRTMTAGTRKVWFITGAGRGITIVSPSRRIGLAAGAPACSASSACWFSVGSIDGS